MKIFIVFIVITFAATGCAMWDKHLADSTHYCTHEKDGKKKGPFPVKLKAGMDTVWQEDGWTITCSPIQKTEPKP